MRTPFGAQDEQGFGCGPHDSNNGRLPNFIRRVGQPYALRRDEPGRTSGYYPRGLPTVHCRPGPRRARSDDGPVGTLAAGRAPRSVGDVARDATP